MTPTPLDEAPVNASGYRTAPDPRQTGFPPGVPYIIGNEAAERFSYYGMKAILTLYMVKFLMLQEHTADKYTHWFGSGVYFLPVLGALLSDGLLGKYRTILWLSIVYCAGHVALAMNDTLTGLFIGLILICFGAGGIKPCVSANVGDQFGPANKGLLSKTFGWFYFSINAGSFISSFLCPYLLDDPRFGPHWAFGVPGVAMGIATICFWLGRRKFVHVPPAGLGFVREALSRKGLLALARLASIYVFIGVFWALWNQSNGVEWSVQATKMDLHFLGRVLRAGQVQTANPIFILLFIPLVNYLVYPAISRVFPLTPLRKIGIGLFITASSFLVIAHIQNHIDAGEHPTVWWQILAYAIITLGEAMVSITGLEFSYTQAPTSMKSAVMALWLFAVSLGEQIDGAVNAFVVNKDGSRNMSDTQFFLFFAGLMFVAACVYIVVACFYKGETYLQGEGERAEADIAAATSMPA